jgi:outer membrane protein OmpA-like peptidoglycan-associated protein
MKNIVFLILIFFYYTSQSQSQLNDFEVFNTSVNSKFADLGATYLNDKTIIFASSKKEETGRRKNNRQLSLELYLGEIAENGDIIQTDKFSKEINNKFFESDITFSSDLKTIYFTWNNYYSSLRFEGLEKVKTLYLFKASINENFELSNIQPLPFNSKDYSVRSPRLSKDEKQLFFVSDMDGGYGETDIYVVDIFENGSFSAPKNLGPQINTSNAEQYPFVDENNTLYFSSPGRGGLGKLDIFKSENINGEYQKAENLPAPINSIYDDFAFVLNTTNDSGFLTSNRDDALGNVDIYAFKTKKPECNQSLAGLVYNKKTGKQIENVQISLVENNKVIDTHINQFEKKYNFKLECAKNYKLIAEKENFETFEININTNEINAQIINQNIYLNPIECNQIIAGLLFNKSNGQQLDNVKVTLIQNNKTLENSIVEKGYKYQFNLQCNQTYKIIAEKPGFIPAEVEINTNNIDKTEISKTIALEPIECKQLITGTILDKDTNLPMPNAMVELFKNSVLLKTLPLDSVANFNFKADCNSNYRIVASFKNYRDDVTVIQTSNKNDDTVHRKLFLESNVEFVTVREQKMIKTNTIYFDLDKADIRPDAAIELTKVVNILLKYPTIKIEIKSHTDSRAPDNYNMKLSNRRAESTINYIISNGIDASRVSGKGYGETELVNNCKNGVKCSEAEHQLNRRTEFIVIDE